MAEQVERFPDVVEREPVRDYRAKIDPMVLDRRHQTAHAFLAARAERRDDLLIGEPCVERFIRRHHFARVDAQTRQRASGANRAKPRAYELYR